MRCECGGKAYEEHTSTGEPLGVWCCERCGQQVDPPIITGPSYIEDDEPGVVIHTTRGGKGHVGRVYDAS